MPWGEVERLTSSDEERSSCPSEWSEELEVEDDKWVVEDSFLERKADESGKQKHPEQVGEDQLKKIVSNQEKNESSASVNVTRNQKTILVDIREGQQSPIDCAGNFLGTDKNRRSNHLAGKVWKGQGDSNFQDQAVRSYFNEKEKEKQVNKEGIKSNKEVGCGDINSEEVGPPKDMGRDVIDHNSSRLDSGINSKMDHSIGSIPECKPRGYTSLMQHSNRSQEEEVHVQTGKSTAATGKMNSDYSGGEEGRGRELKEIRKCQYKRNSYIPFKYTYKLPKISPPQKANLFAMA
ncbi:hypothetical protein L6452_05881 [Arctium lappa]|uniref:Uncharacterized protein n=1 Tax=Arctium lappa TaxID=4217 RepID=A0ACB9EIN7_ARCLA|nr:hypothetical protein L6452_05881 [Arctium lappa]